ncbi:MAG: lysylphosphatidylglycerol synthase domain-containing protein [Phycisphaerales bacterium]
MSTDAEQGGPGPGVGEPGASAGGVAGATAAVEAAAQEAGVSSGRGRLVVQAVGFVIGIGLMTWCVYAALASEEKRAQLGRLLDAPWWMLGAMLALSFGTVAVDGLFFRAVLRPVRGVGAGTMLGVSGVCSALSYLPFKMSMLFRIVYHTRRDGMTIVDVLAWIGAAGVLLLVSLAPIGVLAFAWPTEDLGGPAWWGALGVMVLGGAVMVNVSSRVIRASGAATWIAARLPGRNMTERLLEGLTMLADRRAAAEAMGMRVAIAVMQTARFALAAHLVGVEVSVAEALIAGGAYNLIQAISPGGVSGFREAGATAALHFMQGPEILAVTLTVSATEAAMNLMMGLAGGVYLRVDRLWERRRRET